MYVKFIWDLDKWLIKTGGLLIQCVLGTRCMSLITSIPPTQHVYTDYAIHILGACSHYCYM